MYSRFITFNGFNLVHYCIVLKSKHLAQGEGFERRTVNGAGRRLR